MPGITLQQIEIFLTVAEHLNITEAAKSMYLSQPLLSNTIKRLEKNIDVKLFIRNNRGLELTNEGKYLYSALRVPFSKISRELRAASEMFHKKSRVLRIGLHSSYDASNQYSAMLKALREFRKAYPESPITEELFEFRELKLSLIRGEVDIIIGPDFVLEDLQDTSRKPIARLDLFIAMSASHPMAKCSNFDELALDDEVFYFVSSDDIGRNNPSELERCNELGFYPKRIEFLSNFTSVIMAVRQEKGMTLCGYIKTLEAANELKFIPTPVLNNHPYQVVVWRKDDVSPEAKTFIDNLPDVKMY